LKPKAHLLAILVFALQVIPFTPALSADENADKVSALLQQGMDEIKSGQFEKAIHSLEQANKLKGSACYECYLALAVAYNALNSGDDAKESAQKAITAASNENERARAQNTHGTLIMRYAGADRKQLRAAENEFRQILAERDDAEAHLNLGVDLLTQKRDDEGKTELRAFLQRVPSGPIADRAAKLIADPRRVGQSFAPDFSVKTVQGNTYTLKDLSGKIVVLDFWATWCQPCRASVSDLRDLRKKYSNDQLVLISLSADDDAQKWKDFIEKKQMDWPQVLDSEHEMRTLFGVHAFPTYVIIDGDGFEQEIVGENPQESVVYRLKATLQSMAQPRK
jgi:peroxiredoxin/Tfp pilus assembly protein PilF